MIEANAIRRTDLVWLQGMPEWIEAGKVPEFFQHPSSSPELVLPVSQVHSLNEDAEPDPRPRRKRRKSPQGILIAIVGCLAFIAVLFAIAIVQVRSGSEGFGKRLEFARGGEVFYTSRVTESEAQKLGNFLVQEGYFDGPRKSVQLTSDGGHFQVRLVTVARVENDEEFLSNYEIMADQFSRNVFNGSPVEIHVCDEYLNTRRVVQQPAKR